MIYSEPFFIAFLNLNIFGTNVVAHSLARAATFWSSPQVLDYLPSCISLSNTII